MLTVCAFVFRKSSFFYDLLRNLDRIRGLHIFHEYSERFANKYQFARWHASIEGRVHLLEIARKVSLVQKIEL